MYASEIARLREQIELQLEAMHRGLRGLTSGTARHAFIYERMERIEEYQDALAAYIGEHTASQIVCDIYVEVMEREQSMNKLTSQQR
ncbi:MAG TPA: hypothetical protein VFA09_02590 [Ktedonobacteraceae bacterium]|nr:hypothetical protein [Ktedonobacteraceae bacterium]